MILSQQMQNEIIDLYYEEISETKIAEKYNVDKRTISYFLRKNGYPSFRPKCHKLNEDQIEKIYELVDKGKTNKQIAKIMGCSPTTVSKYRRNIQEKTERYIVPKYKEVPEIKVGQNVIVKNLDKRIMKGTVCAVYSNFFNVTNGKYQESICYTDILTGYVEVQNG